MPSAASVKPSAMKKKGKEGGRRLVADHGNQIISFLFGGKRGKEEC